MMVLGTETPPEGAIMDTQVKNTEPVVGEFATHQVGSDSYAVEIIARSKSGMTVTTRDAGVVNDSALPGDADYAGVPEGTYVIVPNERGRVRTSRRDKHGHYTATGGTSTMRTGRVRVHRDPSF